MDNFVNIKFESNNLDRYVIRKAILESIKDNLAEFSGKFLDVGCGKMPYREYILDNSKVQEYIGLDIETALVYDTQIKPDFYWKGKDMPFRENTFDCAFATEVLEHCPEPETVLKEIFRVLKPGGVLFLTVPFLWNLHEVPNDEYRYTPFSLKRHLRNSGFTEIKIEATGGWHASMAQMIGLWVRRSPMKGNRRKILSAVLKPLIKHLIKLDKASPVFFTEGQMITGLYGLVRKK